MVKLVNVHPVYIGILYAICFIIAVDSLVRVWAPPTCPSYMHKKSLFNRDLRDGQVLNFLAGCLELTLRLLMSYIYIYIHIYIYIYGAPILDVSRSHTTTHHSR